MENFIDTLISINPILYLGSLILIIVNLIRLRSAKDRTSLITFTGVFYCIFAVAMSLAIVIYCYPLFPLALLLSILGYQANINASIKKNIVSKKASLALSVIINIVALAFIFLLMVIIALFIDGSIFSKHSY